MIAYANPASGLASPTHQKIASLFRGEGVEHAVRKTTAFLVAPFFTNNRIFLTRQARDKHKETLRKEEFSAGEASAAGREERGGREGSGAEERA